MQYKKGVNAKANEPCLFFRISHVEFIFADKLCVNGNLITAYNKSKSFADTERLSDGSCAAFRRRSAKQFTYIYCVLRLRLSTLKFRQGLLNRTTSTEYSFICVRNFQHVFSYI